MIAIDRTDADAAASEVDAIGARFADPAELLDHVGARLLAFELRNVDQRQGPGGADFPDYTRSYAKWKERHFPGKPMLHLHEVLVPGFSVSVDRGERSVQAGPFEAGPSQAQAYAATVTDKRDPFWASDQDLDGLAEESASYYESGGFGQAAA